MLEFIRPDTLLPSAQKQSDEHLIFELQSQIPGLKQSLHLAGLIANYPASKSSRHPVVNFAFARVGGATIASIALRMSEAVDPYLDRAFSRVFGESLLMKRGRDRVPRDPELALLMQFRHEMVAHRAKLGGFDGEAFASMLKTYKSPFRFFEVVLDRIDELISELIIAGYFEGAHLQAVSVYRPPEFTQSDVRQIVAAGNRLAPKPTR